MKPVPAGQSVEVTIRAQVRGARVPEGATVLAECWPPGETTGREPAHTFVASWDPRSRCWYAVLDTTGWAPGVWQVRTPVDGDLDGEEVTGWSWTEVPVTA